MIRFLAVLSACLLVGACSSTQKEPPRQIPIAKASVLPLALSDDFEFRKVSLFFNDPRDTYAQRPTMSPMINFERQRVNFGAVSGYDRAERMGHYFYIWWRAKREADLIVRSEDGRISSWRVLLIEDGKIVGLRQSFLWN
jgi:hypothetical protein